MSLATFVCWKWVQPGCRSAYEAEHVNVWASMLKRSYTGDLRIICVTDNPVGITECETYPLWNDHASIPNPNGGHLPSCFRRLKIFNEAQTREMGIDKGSKVISMDLDVVFLADVTSMFAIATTDFVGWRRIGPGHPNGYNGSVFMFRTGMMDRIWDTFDPDKSPMIARRQKYYGSDQGWMSYILSGTMPGWGKVDGLYSFSSDICGKTFPLNARLISFNGKAKPWHPLVQHQHPWISRYWKKGEIIPGDFKSRVPLKPRRFGYR